MAISDTQKIDWLWKKLGYGVAKTDVNSVKDATNEATPSPLLIRGDNLWASSSDIPSTKPVASSSIVEIYDDSGGGQATVEATEDLTSTSDRTWETGLTNWIPPEFGSTYLVKVYADNASAANPQTTGTQLFPTGSGNEDQWFFDYQSGILNFIGDNLPSGVSGKSIYIVGARYVGSLGPSKIFFDDTKVEVTGSEDVIVEINAANKLTVNSSGLTVNGSATISNANPFLYLIESDVTDLNTVLKTNSGEFLIQTVNDALTVSTTRLKINHTTGDITLSGNTTIDAQNDLRFADADSSNYVAFQSPATVASDVTWTLPDADAAVSGYALVSDAAGTLSWAAAGATITNDETTNTNFLIYFESTTTGVLNTVKQDSNFTYNPSTGTLNVEDLVLSGDLTVNGTTTTINTTNTTVSDSLIELSSGTTGAPANDSGFVVERGDENNAFIGWDESADQFVVGTGTFTGASTGNLTFTVAPFASGALDVTGNITVSGTVDGRDIDADGTKLDGIDSNANNYTHPNHTGDVTSTGDGATVIANDAVTYAKIQNVVSDNVLLGNNAGAGGIVDELTATEVRTLINVEDGANAYTHPNHTGDVTSTGDGATVIADDAVTYAKIQNVVADNVLLGNNAGAGGIVDELTATEVRTLLNVEDGANAYTHPNHTGDVTSTGDGATVIADDAVTYAKIQNVVADNVLLGNISGAGGIVDELTATEVRTLLNVSDGAATGTVTSVDMSTPTGLVVSGNPITTSGTLALALDTGYEIPLTSTLDTFITASSTDTLTNKTIDANGTGNSITNLEIADFAGSAIQTSAEIATPGFVDNDTSLLTAAAIDDRYSTLASPTFTGTVNTDNLIVGGDLTVNGTTTTVSTTNMVVEDSLIELSNGTTGAPANDSGIVIERGDENNAFIGWDESADQFVVGTGTFTGASTGNLTFTVAPLATGALDVTGNITVSGTVDGRDIDADGTKLDGIDSNANNYTHPNHTGDVTSTGDGATVIANDAVTYAKIQNVAADNVLLGNNAGAGGIVDELTATEVRTLINVEDGANNYTHPNHTGDVTSTGDGATVIANDAVTYAKIQNVVADNVLLGNNAGAGGIVDELTATEVRTILNVEDGANAYTHPNHTGDVTSTGDGATVIANDAVTYAKIQNVVSDNVLLGNNAGAGGIVDELTATEVRTILNVEDGANAYTHPNHTGDVTSTGDGVTVIANDAVTYAKIQNVVSDNVLLGNNAGVGGIVAELTAANVRTILNVEDGATADQTTEEIQDGAWGGDTLTGTQTGITVTYDDANNNVDFVTEVTLAGSETLTNKTIDGDSNTLSNLDIGNEVDWAAATDVSDAAAFEPGDKILIHEAGVGLRKIDYNDLPGAAGGLLNVVEDTTPQLGGQLDVNGNAIGDGTNELLTFVEDASAVNHIEIENEATGSGPIVRSTGDDTNVELNIDTKGTADINLLDNVSVTGDITISKTSPLITLFDNNITTGSYPGIEFDTSNSQGVLLEFNEFDGELPAAGYGLILKESSTNTQFPSTGTLSLTVLGEIYTGATTVGSVTRVLTTADEGSGNGLDADTLDGQEGSYYAPLASPTFTGTINGADLILSGDLTVNGTTTTVNTTNLVVSDNLIELNNGVASNANDSGIVIERGSTGDNAFIGWDESADKFIVGTTTATGASTGDLTITTGTLVANIEGALTGNADTASALSSAVTVQLTGDVTGSATFTNAGDTASISTTIAANSVALGTDTTGNYVGAGATSGNGISGSLSAEGGTFTVTSNATNANTASTIVFRDASGDFSAGTITAALSGNATTATTATTATNITVADESVDTACNVVFVTAATGDLPPKTGTNLTFNSSTGALTATSFSGSLSGNASTASALSSAVTVQLTGDVTGSATFTNAGDTASIATTIAANSVALGTDTTGNYVGAGATSGNGISGSLSAEGGTFTVTSNATNANTASTIVFRDASGNFSAGTITAALSGNATTATTATTSTNITVADESTDTACNVVFVTAATGDLPPKTGTNLTFNSSTGALTATSFVGSLTGNADTASSAAQWTTTRTINMTGDVTSDAVNIDGSGNITITNTAVTNDSHTHAFDNLTGKTSGTGEYSTSGIIESGRGSGGVALTINDGYGNANVTFNHKSGTPEQNGNSARIEANTDATSGSALYFEVGSNVTASTPVSLTTSLTLTETDATFVGDILPDTDNTGNVGTTAATWNNGQFSNLTVNSTLSVRAAIDLADSDVLRLGSSDDFLMFYDGTANELELEMEAACTQIRVTDNATTRFTFAKATGDFTATGEVTAYSDQRLKSDIATIDNGLELVKSMRGVTYTKDDRPGVGVIAQEIEQVLPQVVRENDEGYKSVAYGNVVGVLIEAIKEQQTQIDALKQEIDKLKNA